MGATPIAPAQVRVRLRRRRALVLVLVIVVAYVAVGFTRAPAVAMEYVTSLESGRRVSDVATSTFPVIPPFWIVDIQNQVTESTGVSYESALILVLEPITGYVLG